MDDKQLLELAQQVIELAEKNASNHQLEETMSRDREWTTLGDFK